MRDAIKRGDLTTGPSNLSRFGNEFDWKRLLNDRPAICTSIAAGIDWMPNAIASCCSSSVFTFARISLPFASATSFSRIGPSCRHGAHHGAQKSMMTGVSADF